MNQDDAHGVNIVNRPSKRNSTNLAVKALVNLAHSVSRNRYPIASM